MGIPSVGGGGGAVITLCPELKCGSILVINVMSSWARLERILKSRFRSSCLFVWLRISLIISCALTAFIILNRSTLVGVLSL